MLGTAEQLAAGLGAQPKAPAKADTSKVTPTPTDRDGVGNAHLRLWIGERNLGRLTAFLSNLAKFNFSRTQTA